MTASQILGGQILMMQPLSDLSQTYALLAQEEKQRECTNTSSVLDSTAASALLARAGPYKPYKAHNSVVSQNNSSSGHSPGPSGNAYNPNGYKKSCKKGTQFCTHCKSTNHIRDTCFQLNGYPDWYKGARIAQASVNMSDSHGGLYSQQHNITSSEVSSQPHGPRSSGYFSSEQSSPCGIGNSSNSFFQGSLGLQTSTNSVEVQNLPSMDLSHHEANQVRQYLQHDKTALLADILIW